MTVTNESRETAPRRLLDGGPRAVRRLKEEGEIVSDDKSTSDRLLDLFLFLPAGVAMTVVEEAPKLVDRGRTEIEKRIYTSRTVGEFAYRFGRSELERRIGPVISSRPSPGGRKTPAPRISKEVKEGGEAGGQSAPAGQRSSKPPGSPSQSGSAEHLGGAPGTPSASERTRHLAIPGYDSLSASQVVQRLGGLSRRELEEVRDHEEASRARRTVLNKAEQLLSGRDVAPCSPDAESVSGDTTTGPPSAGPSRDEPAGAES